MAGQKDHLVSGELSPDVSVRRSAKRRFEADFLLRGKGSELVKTATADDSNGRDRHTLDFSGSGAFAQY
jgi:hypothetical protein